MFLNKSYVLSAELAQKMNITINNFSKWYNSNPDLIGTDLIKMGECLFFKKNTKLLWESHAKALETLRLTDFSNKLPITWLKSEFKFNPQYAEKQGLGKVVDVAKKKFFEFDCDFAYKNRYKTWYPMTKEEFNCGEYDDLISMDVSKNNVIVLY